MTWTTRQRSEVAGIAAISVGDGPHVVFLHGVGLRAESWGAQIDSLAQQHSILAIDLPGHGQSARLPSDAQRADFTDAIAAAITTPSVVIGHSFGAMIALDLAVRHPHLLRGVVALNSIYQRDADARIAVLARAANLDGQTPPDPTATLSRWFGDQPSDARTACRDWLLQVDPAGYRAAYTVFAAEDGPASEDLTHLQCPALFITGTDEPNSTPDMSRRMASLTPRGEAIVIDGAAHMLPMTHAAALAPLLQRFVEEHAA